MTPEVTPLIVECERAGIRLSVDGGKLVIEAPAGVVKPDLLARLRQHKAALVEALTSGPAEAQAVEANTAPGSDLPPGWPSDVAPPAWWAEFLSIKDRIRLLAARAQVCGDSACAFPVMIEWEAPGCPREWSCPACGRTADRG